MFFNTLNNVHTAQRLIDSEVCTMHIGFGKVYLPLKMNKNFAKQKAS